MNQLPLPADTAEAKLEARKEVLGTMHAALRHGMSPDEIKEVFRQSAIDCSVPASNTAFKIGKDVLSQYETETK